MYMTFACANKIVETLHFALRSCREAGLLPVGHVSAEPL